jgi:putative peptidoglycan lipid II flippase
MLKKLLSVSGWTLVSRVSGFIRDLVLAAVLGAGTLMDVFTVANRLPNHFRAIFAEGAFNTAFIPAYARVLMMHDVPVARRFAGMIGVLLTLALLVLTVLAMLFMPTLVSWLAPGFVARPEAFELAVMLTRITFPYLILVSLVTLVSGVLNAHERFGAAAAAPVLLNLSIIGAVLIAWMFPNSAYAAAWGVLMAGVLELILVVVAAIHAKIMPVPAKPQLTLEVRAFFKALGPATLGSMGTQLAMFADTILVTFLAVGGASALYYADRLYQLPLGVIGIAAGTVLLPHMSRLLASGDETSAHRAQNRSLSFTLILAAPCFVMFLIAPTLLFEALFMRGAFDQNAANNAGSVLAAYAVGFPAMVCLRSIVASFYARQDTSRPVIASLTAIGINIALKIMLMPTMGAAGLALSTAIGAWVNVGILYIWALTKGWTKPDIHLMRTTFSIVLAALTMGLTLWQAFPYISLQTAIFSSLLKEGGGLTFITPSLIQLSLFGGLGVMVYGVVYGVCVKGLKSFTQSL